MNNQKDARSALADNMKRLMETWNIGVKELADEIGYDWYTIRLLLEPEAFVSPRLCTIEAVAEVFELQAWQLLMPDLPVVDQPEQDES